VDDDGVVYREAGRSAEPVRELFGHDRETRISIRALLSEKEIDRKLRTYLEEIDGDETQTEAEV
jgi:selenocysteine lyase/cysteine desulfurase